LLIFPLWGSKSGHNLWRMAMVSIKGMNKADVLAGLFNAARAQGMGFMNYNGKPMTREGAQKILDSGQTYFDYVEGRVMKVDLSKDDEFDEWGFDRDNGGGSAQRVITAIRGSGNTNPNAVQEIHRTGILAAAEATKEMLGEESTVDGNVAHLGLKDLSNVLGSKVNRAAKKAAR